jgi:hypothetical protein
MKGKKFGSDQAEAVIQRKFEGALCLGLLLQRFTSGGDFLPLLFPLRLILPKPLTIYGLLFTMANAGAVPALLTTQFATTLA